MARIARSQVTQVEVRRSASCRLWVDTPGEGFTDLTDAARAFLDDIGAGVGVLAVFCRHTSASLTLQENADPDVRTDLITALRMLAPRDFGWRHHVEGPDDMPAHMRTMLTDASLTLPVAAGSLLVGTWQGLYLIEHRSRPQRREVVLSYLGS